jgi:putative MATE family efflux protein
MDSDQSSAPSGTPAGRPQGLYGSILSLALPLILANLVQQIYNMTDLFFLGRYVNSEALAAAGVSTQISWLIIYMFVGLSVGVGIVTAKSYGERSAVKLAAAAHTAAALSVVSGAFVAGLGYALSPFLLMIVNTPSEIMPVARIYLRIHFLGMFPFIVYTMMSAVLRGIGDTRTSMYALSISLVVKFTLVFILVKSMGGGVGSAAFATICAQGAAALTVILKLLLAKGDHRVSLGKIKIHLVTLKDIASIGIPAGMQSLAQYLANVYFQSQVNIFGPDVTAGMITFTRFEGLIYMPIEGFALAASTLVGQNIGAKRPDMVPRIMNRTTIMSVGVTLILSAIVMISGPYVMALFNPHNPRAAEIGYRFVLYITPSYFLYSLMQNFGGVIRGTGEARVPMVIILIFVCGARMLWISLSNHSLTLLFFTYPISWSLAYIAFQIYYLKGRWLSRFYGEGVREGKA